MAGDSRTTKRQALIDYVVAGVLSIGPLLGYSYSQGELFAAGLFVSYWSQEIAILHLGLLCAVSLSFLWALIHKSDLARQLTLLLVYPIVGVLSTKLMVWLIAVFGGYGLEMSWIGPNWILVTIAVCVVYIVWRMSNDTRDALSVAKLLLGVSLLAVVILKSIPLQP